MWGISVCFNRINDIWAASVLAVSATSPEMLIIARVILAIGAAAMMPPTLSIIKRTFVDEQERAFALGVWSAIRILQEQV